MGPRHIDSGQRNPEPTTAATTTPGFISVCFWLLDQPRCQSDFMHNFRATLPLLSFIVRHFYLRPLDLLYIYFPGRICHNALNILFPFSLSTSIHPTPAKCLVWFSFWTHLNRIFSFTKLNRIRRRRTGNVWHRQLLRLKEGPVYVALYIQ